jgi:hypothetical protein
VITLERLDELQVGHGELVTREELLELVLSHMLVQRLNRIIDGHTRRLESLRGDIDAALGIVPEPAFVAPVITDEEIASV